jgi:hypothetical protein
LQVQHRRNSNMRARRHRYLSAAAAAFRLLVAAATTHRRRRLHLLQQQHTCSTSRRHFCSRTAFTAWLMLHSRCVCKRASLASASRHFRRSALARVMCHVRALAR